MGCDRSVGDGTLGLVRMRDPADVEAVLRAQGHKPDGEDIDRLQRLLRGEVTLAEAYAELDAEFGQGRPERPEDA